MTLEEIRNLKDCFRVPGMFNPRNALCNKCPDRYRCSGERKKEKVKEEKKKVSKKKNQPIRNNTIYSTKPAKNPKTRGDAIRHFANAILNLSPDLKYHQGKNGISLWTEKHTVLVLSIGGTATTLRLASSFFREDEDPGCEKDSKGYPTVVFERPESIEEVVSIAIRALKRAGVTLKGDK